MYLGRQSNIYQTERKIHVSKWIWKFGEYETYHNILLHDRRQQYGYTETPVWKIYACDPVVCFYKTVYSKGGKIHIYAKGKYVTEILSLDNGPKDGMPNLPQKFEGAPEITLPKGNITIMIRVSNHDTFPSILVTGEVATDETWTASDLAEEPSPVGSAPYYTEPEDDPAVFPFMYEKITETAKRDAVDDAGNEGVLIDFGNETFARTVFTVSEFNKEKPVIIRFGESEEEALSHLWCVTNFCDRPENGRLSYPAYAFRYLFVSDRGVRVDADYERNPIPVRGKFTSDEDGINRVYNTAAYTFELCSREFFIDGIKRDRWVWSADAYQSMFVAHSLFMEPEIEKRTLIALGGKTPVKSYINGIMDYDYFWVLSVRDYYLTYGDQSFLRQILPQLEEVMKFCATRECADGFVRGKKDDWIFIDWAPMDKTGALSGEQILYAAALDAEAEILEAVGNNSDSSPDEISCGNNAENPTKTAGKTTALREKAAALRESIMQKFYDSEKGVFIDSYESGKQSITRQNNLFAYLYLPLSREQKKKIYHNVILNDEVLPITTPYFKFYENQVHCEEGNLALLTDSLRSYYGKMLSLGATTFYEQFDPSQTGPERFAMYGRPFEKSLCHAWSCSPIYLLARYVAGVRNTGIAYNSFAVEPNPGDLKEFQAVVPLPANNKVTVSVTPDSISVTSSIDGGTLHYGGQEMKIPAWTSVRVAR